MPAYEVSVRVSDADIDFLGHVNNLQYLRWMMDAAVAHSTALGWPTQRYVDTGAVWVVRSHHIEYLSPAFIDDQLVVQTWIANFGRVRCLRKYRIVRRDDERLLSRGETDWTFVSLEKQVPTRIPVEVLNSFEAVEEPDARDETD